jgi:hypothetical protein
MRHHNCDNDDDIFDPCEDPCARPADPCETRWRRDAAYRRRTRKENGTIVLIGVLIAVAAVATFALFASGVLVWNSVEDDRVVGVPATGDCDKCGTSGTGGAGVGDITVNTDKIGITTDKIIVDKDRGHDYKDKHNDD